MREITPLPYQDMPHDTVVTARDYADGTLLRERVPFEVGGMSPGQSDDVALLTASDELSGPFIELSWSAPQHWILREIVGSAQEWATESDTGKIASSAFNL